MTEEKQNMSDSAFIAYRLKRLEDDVRKAQDKLESLDTKTIQLDKRTDELKLYITQSLNTIETISSDFEKLDRLSSERHESQQEKWTDFFKKITYLVIGAIITYLFSQFR